MFPKGSRRPGALCPRCQPTLFVAVVAAIAVLFGSMAGVASATTYDGSLRMTCDAISDGFTCSYTGMDSRVTAYDAWGYTNSGSGVDPFDVLSAASGTSGTFTVHGLESSTYQVFIQGWTSNSSDWGTLPFCSDGYNCSGDANYNSADPGEWCQTGACENTGWSPQGSSVTVTNPGRSLAGLYVTNGKWEGSGPQLQSDFGGSVLYVDPAYSSCDGTDVCPQSQSAPSGYSGGGGGGGGGTFAVTDLTGPVQSYWLDGVLGLLGTLGVFVGSKVAIAHGFRFMGRS